MTSVDRRDRQLEANVRSELALDPRVDVASTVAVGVQAGFVTLRGTVASLKQRRAVLRAVKRCLGVCGIGDRLLVRVAAGHRPGDAELRGAALQALADAPGLAADSLDIRASDGW
jgi:hypothetical protein